MSPEPRRRRLVIPWSDVLITIASIVLAFIVGALLMIFSDTEVRSKFAYFFARPSDALIASWEKVSSAYGALIKGAVGGYGPITETTAQAAPLICAGLGVGWHSAPACSTSVPRARPSSARSWLPTSASPGTCHRASTYFWPLSAGCSVAHSGEASLAG